uniref:Uncharacterized protein n=1 Tax=Bombyx mori TaxID=7091 RepID=A0A8R2MBF1_BOMMO|nr:uncharacterized protein LOC119630789 [Bombyx mori]
MDFLDSLDLDTDNKSQRVRSWYLYEQFKEIEKNQLDAPGDSRTNRIKIKSCATGSQKGKPEEGFMTSSELVKVIQGCTIVLSMEMRPYSVLALKIYSKALLTSMTKPLMVSMIFMMT